MPFSLRPASHTHTSDKAPVFLHNRAMENLRFIRATMERATSYTMVSGLGQILVGLTALLAAGIAATQSRTELWLLTWLIEAVLSVLISSLMMLKKAQAAKLPLFTETGRKFLLSFTPAMVVGAFLTAVFYQYQLQALIPGTWLLLYGTGVIASGTYSAPIVPFMGLGFMLLGMLAIITPASWGNGWMAGGFGGLHIIFGMLIARRYGG